MSNYLETNTEYPNKEHIDGFNIFNKYMELILNGKSIFDHSINFMNSDELFNIYEKNIIEKYINTTDHHTEKYKQQLKGTSNEFKHFFATLTWIRLYPILDMHTENKISEINLYLPKGSEISEKDDYFKYKGVAHYGRLRVKTYEDLNMIFFFIRTYKKNRTKNLNDILNEIDYYDEYTLGEDRSTTRHDSIPSRHMLNYFFNKEHYEPIVDASAKRRILEYYHVPSISTMDKVTIDKNLYQIRVDINDFKISLFSQVELGIKTNKKATTATFSSTSSDIDYKKKNIDSHDEILESYKKKLENGLKAEILVWEKLKKEIDKPSFINIIKQEFDFSFDYAAQNFEKIMHYSKNYNTYAPFDLLTVDENELIYVEVKSTTSDVVYFSKQEIKFANEHQDCYIVYIVKDEEIYTFDYSDTIRDIYTQMFKNNDWSFDTVKIRITFIP